MKMSKEILLQMKPVCTIWWNNMYCSGKKGHQSPQFPEKDTRPMDQWAIRRAEQHLKAEANRDDNNNNCDMSITSNATSGTNRSLQRKG